MAHFPSEPSEIEKLLLRAICQPACGDDVWAVAANSLRAYRWREPAHQALFEAVRDLSTRKPALLREFLPIALTRRGFPDLDWRELFDPVSLSEEDARTLVQQLLSANRT